MPISPSFVQAFYQAYAKRDIDAVMEFIADDIDWKFLGPVEVFSFCGHRRGKAAVVDHFSRLMPARLAVRRLEPDELVIDGDRAATFSKITSVEKVSGRTLTYHCAHFITFRDGKAVIMRAIADTFGVLEQLSCVELLVGPDGDDAREAGFMPAQENAANSRNAAAAMPAFLEKFYDAYLSADPGRLDDVLDEDVTWLLSGPADYLDLFGYRRGKAAVVELITRVMPCYHRLTGFEIEQLLVQGENVAVFGRVCSRQRETGRVIRFGYTHFMRFRDGKLVSFRGLADSYDAVSQIMGCRIVARDGASLVPMMLEGDLAAV